MQHFYDYLNSNKCNRDELAKADVVVSLKVDGTALQISISNTGKDYQAISFCKRGKDDMNPGPPLTQLDAFTDYEYFTAVKNLAPALKENKDKFQGVKLISTEILSEDSQHFVQYNQLPPKGVCLLTAVSVNDNTIKESMLKQYAKMLGIELIPTIYSGTLESCFDKLADYVTNHCDFHNPQDTGSFKSDILSLLGVDESTLASPLLDTKDGKIEGFVFNFKLSDGHIMLKIDSPDFMSFIASQKNDEKDDSLSQVAKDILNKVQDINFKKFSNDKFENLLQNFDVALQANPDFIDFMFQCSENARPTLDGLLDATAKDISIFPKKFRDKFKGVDKFFPAFRMFVWAFGKKKSGKNYPEMTKFNPIIEKMGTDA